MPLILPNDFVNGEIADAVPVQNNYDLIQGYINSEVITADGLTQMKAPLLLRNGDPTQPNHAASKDYVDGQMPIGTMLMWPAVDAPAGSKWHLCDGGSLSTSTHNVLFDRIGYLYGGSGGAFLLPNLKGRFPIGLDTSKVAFDTVGEAGGTFTVPVPQHFHGIAHDHGSFNSGNADVGHVHSIAHDHGAVNTSDPLAGHSHDLSVRQNSTPGTTGSLMTASATGTTVATNTGNDTGTPHVHQLNMPSYAGNSGSSGQAHVHSINVPNYPSGAVGAGAGAPGHSALNVSTSTPTGVSTTMIQPYLTVNFIIRII